VDVHVLTGQQQNVTRALCDDDPRWSARHTLGFEGPAQRGDEGTQGADGSLRRIGPQVLDQGVGGDHPALGGDKPTEHLAMARPAQLDGTAVITEGPHRSEHVNAHVPILRAGVGCAQSH
jgi:hypothetical protein